MTATSQSPTSSLSWKALPHDVLPVCVWNSVDRADTEPFRNDLEYFEYLVACEAVWKRIIELEWASRASVYKPTDADFGKPTAERFLEGRRLRRSLMELVAYLDKKRLESIALGSVPLVERFLDCLGVRDIEKDVFRFLLVAVSGAIREVESQHFSLSDTGAVGFVSAKEAYQRFSNELSLPDFLAMTSRESKWIEEHLLERTDALGDENWSAISNTTLRVFIGFPVLSERVYTDIESPLLQSVLLNYEPFTSSETGKKVLNDQRRLTPAEQEDQDVDEDQSNNLIDKLSAVETESNIFDIIGKIQEQERKTADLEAGDDVQLDGVDDGSEYGPYRSELDYLEDQFRQSKVHVMLSTARERAADDTVDDDDRRRELVFQIGGRELTSEEWKLQNIRKAEKLEIRLQKLKDRIRCRLQATKNERKRLPRLEQLTEALTLGEFDRFVILNLIKSTICPDAKKALYGMSNPNEMVNVEHFLSYFNSSLLEVNMKCRRSFYKSGPLIKEGIISLSGQDFTSDLNKCRVFIDRRFVDYICGVDLELSELVDGSHLYTPSVNLEDVILPDALKQRILDSTLNFEKLKAKYRELKLDEKLTYGLGQILLFYGRSGTGKTMMANAIATKLKKKVLLVNFPTLGLNEAGDTIKMLFREARIKKAILFFDECESIFRSRDIGSSAINMCLSELERFDDMCILATNRAYDLDEAMFRRINLAVEFKKPDHLLREKIWEKLKPKDLGLDSDVSFRTLARKYELTGGFIKNVWLSSIAMMMGRKSSTISQADLEKAASEQIVGSLRNEELDRHVVPTAGIECIVASDSVCKKLQDIVDHKKAQSVLFNQWGFAKVHRADTGVTALFHGLPGTGKSMAAEAISFDLGCPLMVVNAAELVNKFVGQTGKNIVSVFNDARNSGAVLVFDEGEGLFARRSTETTSSNSRHDNINVGLLLQHIENFPGVCIVITNLADAIDDAFFRRFNHVVEFEKPDFRLREKLWNMIIPRECPLSSDVSKERLANQFDLSGGEIKSALLRAASRAALRTDENKRTLQMADLEESCTEEITKRKGGRPNMGMYA